MSTRILEIALPGTISDAALLGGRIFAALDSGLVLIEDGSVVRTFSIPVESIVTSDETDQILSVSAVLEEARDIPRRRRIHRIASPFVLPQDLGVVQVNGFSDSFDGRYWPTYEGDDVRLFALNGEGLKLRARYGTFWPISIERIPEGIWLEMSSLGMAHFEVLSVPALELLHGGDLYYSNITFPSELVPYSAWAPTLAQPVAAVHAQNDDIVARSIRNTHRIIIPNGPVITTLPAPPAGLVAAGERALCWFQVDNAMALVLVCLVTASVKDRIVLKGATKAGARIVGRDILVWERNTLRLFHDGAPSSMK
ncbi:MAG: hypothetical protein IPM54_21435 [Polyangiaceae bacterium]|nr:hypothetical protein [Polyangiaceae bacterium]